MKPPLSVLPCNAWVRPAELHFRAALVGYVSAAGVVTLEVDSKGSREAFSLARHVSFCRGRHRMPGIELM